MWVSIIGADGSGKRAVADHLITNHRYKDCSFVPNPSNTSLQKELEILNKRMEQHHVAHKEAVFENALTIRSAIDSVDFFPEYLLKTHRISKSDYDLIRLFRSYVLDRLPLPDCVIFLEIDKINSHNRSKLKNPDTNITDEEINLQSEIYQEIADEIGIPLIRATMAQDFKDVLNEIDFGLSSIRAANLSQRSIFRRDFYR
jgi:thymidylate kinase